MKAERIYVSTNKADNHNYIEADGKLYRFRAIPFRRVSDAEFVECSSPLPLHQQMSALKLIDVTYSPGARRDFRVYGVELSEEQ